MIDDLRGLMEVIQEDCDEQDKSTEFLMAMLEDAVRMWNERHGTALDPYETMMHFLNEDEP